MISIGAILCYSASSLCLVYKDKFNKYFMFLKGSCCDIAFMAESHVVVTYVLNALNFHLTKHEYNKRNKTVHYYSTGQYKYNVRKYGRFISLYVFYAHISSPCLQHKHILQRIFNGTGMLLI